MVAITGGVSNGTTSHCWSNTARFRSPQTVRTPCSHVKRRPSSLVGRSPRFRTVSSASGRIAGTPRPRGSSYPRAFIPRVLVEPARSRFRVDHFSAQFVVGHGAFQAYMPLRRFAMNDVEARDCDCDFLAHAVARRASIAIDGGHLPVGRPGSSARRRPGCLPRGTSGARPLCTRAIPGGGERRILTLPLSTLTRYGQRASDDPTTPRMVLRSRRGAGCNTAPHVISDVL